MFNLKKLSLFTFITALLVYPGFSIAEPIKHEVAYPDGAGPFPTVITLHTSGGYRLSIKFTENFRSKVWTDAGYAVYAPDFFDRHGLTPRTRMFTFSNYREKIEKELSEIVELAKNDPKVDGKNIFAVGFSNGGFWASFLAGTARINAGASHYGVWKGNMGPEITNLYPMKYFSKTSSPVLALHGEADGTQKMRYVKQAWYEVKHSGAKLITHVYPGAGHAWDSKGKLFDAWDPEVKEDAFKRTLNFFKENMR